jgi:uroporphyrinogen decarboxylase
MMNSRERGLRVIQGKLPDRPPIFSSLTPQIAEKLSRVLDLPYESPIDSLLSTRISHTRLLTSLGNDFVCVAAVYPESYKTRRRDDGHLTNEWGMVFKDTGLYNEFIEYPLSRASVKEDITSYPFPEPHAEGRFEKARMSIENYKEDYLIIGDLETSIFETAWYLVGLEKFLTDVLMEAEYIPHLLDRVMLINTQIGQELIRMGVDIIWCGDDFGMQHGMIMDPNTWRKWFKPRIQFMFEAFRKVNPEIKIAWHSCGSILPIIPDFIEIGLDILNPIQPKAHGMNPEYLKKEYGKYLIFFGGIDVQELLPFKDVNEIKREITKLCNILGEGGGYIAAPAHNIQPDTPVENVFAMYEAVSEMGNR